MKIIAPKTIAYRASLLPASASIFAIALALSAQYALGWRPCELCLFQRIPILLAGMAAFGSLYPAQKPYVPRALILLSAVLFFATAVLAGYHVGVEQHWWLYHGACSLDPTAAANTTVDFAQALSQPAVVRCDQPPWAWHGVSMAGLNVLYSLSIGSATLYLLIQDWNKVGQHHGR